MNAYERDVEPLISLADIAEIELVILKRVRGLIMGDHRGVSVGSGFDFVGLRDWQPGDRPSAIDWGQSTLNNFSPLIVREFEQPSTAPVYALVDLSLSTRLGVDGSLITATVMRALATIGLSAVFFQDPFGLMTFDEGFKHIGSIRPRTGKGHVVHCLDAYQQRRGLDPARRVHEISTTLAGLMRTRSMLAVISDFLYDDTQTVLRELSLLNATHDVFLVLVDSSSAFAMPDVSSGWIDVVDVETGRTRTLSRRRLAGLRAHVREWYDKLRHDAKDAGLDLVEVVPDQAKNEITLSEFIAERKLRKTSN